MVVAIVLHHDFSYQYRAAHSPWFFLWFLSRSKLRDASQFFFHYNPPNIAKKTILYFIFDLNSRGVPTVFMFLLTNKKEGITLAETVARSVAFSCFFPLLDLWQLLVRAHAYVLLPRLCCLNWKIWVFGKQWCPILFSSWHFYFYLNWWAIFFC